MPSDDAPDDVRHAPDHAPYDAPDVPRICPKHAPVNAPDMPRSIIFHILEAEVF